MKSSLQWHNETINIDSHIIGGLVFASLPLHFFYVFYQDRSNATLTDFFLFTLYFEGVAVCFVCSARYVMRQDLAKSHPDHLAKNSFIVYKS